MFANMYCLIGQLLLRLLRNGSIYMHTICYFSSASTLYSSYIPCVEFFLYSIIHTPNYTYVIVCLYNVTEIHIIINKQLKIFGSCAFYKHDSDILKILCHCMVFLIGCLSFYIWTLQGLAKHPRWPMSGVTLSPLSNTNPNKPRDCML